MKKHLWRKTLWGFNERGASVASAQPLPHWLLQFLSFAVEEWCIVFECLLWSAKMGAALPKLMAGCSTEWDAGRIGGFVTSAHDAVDPGEGQQSHRIEEGFSHPSAQLLGGMWSRSRFIFIPVLAHLFPGRDSCCLLPEGLMSQAAELGDAHT